MYQSAQSTMTATSPAPNTPSSSRPTPSTTSKWTNGRARSQSTLSTSTPGSTRSTPSPAYSTSPDSTAIRSGKRRFHGWAWVSNHFRFRIFIDVLNQKTVVAFFFWLWLHWTVQSLGKSMMLSIVRFACYKAGWMWLQMYCLVPQNKHDFFLPLPIN